jgi:hypothetical protein
MTLFFQQQIGRVHAFPTNRTPMAGSNAIIPALKEEAVA